MLNPNSTERITREVEGALSRVLSDDAACVRCVTVHKGPAAIVTQRDSDAAIMPMLDLAASFETRADAFVIACFSDPGIHSLREQSRKPVFGIAESSVSAGLKVGRRFGVIAISPESVERHFRYFGALGCRDRLAGELPLGMTMGELTDQARTMSALVRAGQTLRDTHHADVIILGCAGFTAHREIIEEKIGIPVIDPVSTAVTEALSKTSL
ncbi:aspartate/glutamate racemase family protein [Mesorhizobium sp. M7D.F.Ca.US.004.03.1.1]|uniref:aspartate/glutamate racemase family protein n=1 Tax=Mesorhizobium sp. M7D.F.Ca.US.004.03.1.1 TaxID=2496702 RepID=UPI001FE05E98|nr:aspartate/glutamate racemase family protein [Mesorhizobium sp. M7D.F.Ca.US.004.03.1.1]